MPLLTGFDSTVAVGFEGVAAGFEAGLAATAVGVREDLDADLPEPVRPSSEDESPHAWASEEKQSDEETEEDEHEEVS